ncbi:MAG: peptidoglycan DD-metalloendopeptidase family protein [Massilia sp.]
MKQKSYLALLTLSLGLLSACGTGNVKAPVVERHPQPPVEQPRPPVVAAPEPKDDAPGMYTVKKGDTLLRIALDNGQNYRDLVAWNNLSNPNDIKVDQVLRVAPPEHASAPVPAVAQEPRPAPVPKKTSPRGDKRLYSEANLAKLKGESGKDDGKPEPKPGERPAIAAANGAAPAAASAPAASASLPDDEKLSWIWPAEGKIVVPFEEGKNKGIDIAGKVGQQVMAAGSGTVIYAGSGIRGYGNLVMVRHSSSLLSAYGYNRSLLVKEGQNVSRGQVIAEMGDSDADSVKLHFEIRHQGKAVDPLRLLPPR